MQRAWRYRLWGTGRLKTIQGKYIRVLDAGRLNTSGGPDFMDARISIDGNVLAGSIEIHRYASDWHRHGHDDDHAYDNVILHVVGNADCRVATPSGNEILQTVMVVDPAFTDMYNRLLTSERYVLPMCGQHLDRVAGIFKTDWLTSLAFERMMRKAGDIVRLLEADNGNWLQTVFVTLARGLGFGTNADNMERLARSIPYQKLLRHTDNTEVIEAILLGQAGLLNHSAPADEYEAYLSREYNFYATKYGLRPIASPVWHLSARNYANTPLRRLALLAKIISVYGSHLASRLFELKNIDEARAFLNVEVSDYWRYHYGFGRGTGSALSPIGRQSQDLLAINVLAPLVYARGLQTGRHALTDSALALWEGIEAEHNSIIKGFGNYGIEAPNAFTSQALIQLHREYCEKRRCTDCRLGNRLLSSLIAFP